jgi:hypothetical protein
MSYNRYMSYKEKRQTLRQISECERKIFKNEEKEGELTCGGAVMETKCRDDFLDFVEFLTN